MPRDRRPAPPGIVVEDATPATKYSTDRRVIMVGGETIVVGRLDMVGDEAEIQALRPKNLSAKHTRPAGVAEDLPRLPIEEQWSVLVRLKGAEGAYVSAFHAYTAHASQERAERRAKAGVPEYVTRFGAWGKALFLKAKKDTEEFKQLVATATTFDLTTMGTFGEWFRGADIKPQYLPGILKAYFNL